MIISKVNGGLCNQMYFFATAYALSKEWNEELIIDPDIDGSLELTYLLDEFKMPLLKKVIYPIRYNVGKEFVKVAPEIRDNAVIIDETYFEQAGEYLTIPKEKFKSEFPEKDIYLKGTFLQRQMFTKYLSDLREIFTLKESSALVEEFERRIKDVTAIGVHIRRLGFTVLGDDNSIDFFKAAIVYMRERYNNAVFYIFSDELDYVKDDLGTADDIFYMDAMNGYRGDIEEFICLTKCHHYILTRRSTYGRMAEILNNNKNKTSVLFGNNTWNETEDRFCYLSEEDVLRLSGLYQKEQIIYNFQKEKMQVMTSTELKKALIDIALDSEAVTSTDRKEIILMKVKLCEGDRKYGQAIHLCGLLEEQYGENDEGFHKYFGDLLFKYGRVREALVEYIHASKKMDINKDIFQDEEIISYKKLLKQKNRKHYIIAQFGDYTSQYFSEMQMIGLTLARMGNDVSFILKKHSENMFDSQMKRWTNNVDNKYFSLILEKGFGIGKFDYGYRCYDHASVLDNKEDKLKKIAGEYPQEETIIIGREPEILNADVPFRKVFVDFSAPFDEAYLKDKVGESDLQQMYECADIVVTRERKNLKNTQQIIQVNDELIDPMWQNVEKEIPYYEPTRYTNDYLDIALNIAAHC